MAYGQLKLSDLIIIENTKISSVPFFLLVTRADHVRNRTCVEIFNLSLAVDQFGSVLKGEYLSETEMINCKIIHRESV